MPAPARHQQQMHIYCSMQAAEKLCKQHHACVQRSHSHYPRSLCGAYRGAAFCNMMDRKMPSLSGPSHCSECFSKAHHSNAHMRLCEESSACQCTQRPMKLEFWRILQAYASFSSFSGAGKVYSSVAMPFNEKILRLVYACWSS